MLSIADKERFFSDGFLRVPDVFAEEEIQQLREAVDRIMLPEHAFEGDKNDDNYFIRNNLWARYPEFRWLMGHSRFQSCLRSILGDDFVFLPEMSAHASGYGGWHKDTNSQAAQGHQFHWQPDFLMIEAAIYLQDNGESGGGLDVIPGSHAWPSSFWDRCKKVLRLTRHYQIPSRSGDLVLFHFRIDHRASQPQLKPKLRKLALFFACSANNQHAGRYIEYIRGRADYIYMRDSPLYPPEVLDLAKAQGIRLAF